LIEYKEKIWILTFEYAGIVKVGGLGEVPANQTRSLAEYYDFTVFIPSHGQLERLQRTTEMFQLPFSAVGQLNPHELGIDNFERNYKINFYEFILEGVRIILLAGDNDFTKKYLDDKIVYNPETFNCKLCLFSLGMRALIGYLISNKPEKLPEIIHMHDYHVVIPFINIKQEMAKNGLDVPSLITIHLLTWPKYELDFYKTCGIDTTPIKLILPSGIKTLSFEEVYRLCEPEITPETDYQPPTIERIGAIVSDLVLTVSQSYLKTDIIPNLGGDLIEFKSDFVWDGSDWDYEEILQKVLNNLGSEMHEVLQIPEGVEINREDMKKYLLTYKISHLEQSPLINSQKILQIINEISNGNPFIKNGNIQPFLESGPLVITTGRMSRQKGFDLIFKALPEVIQNVPNAKFLMLILPTDYSIEQITEYARIVKEYPNNLRILFGLAADIFHLAHIAADVYCAPSRWEPFGIIALEAMASKLPIVATKVGGLQESILDVREIPEYGTGILVEKDNPDQLAQALITILKLAEIAEKVKMAGSLYADPSILQIANTIPDPVILSRVLLDTNYIEKIRVNAYNRVKFNFRWEIVSRKLIELYNKTKSLHPI